MPARTIVGVDFAVDPPNAGIAPGTLRPDDIKIPFLDEVTGGPRDDARDPSAEPRYDAAYSRDSFRKKVASFAPAAGKKVIRGALTLYRCLRDPATPKWARARIVGALGYFIFPLDAIPDVVPLAGFSDDLGVLALALATVATHIKPEHKEKAEAKLRTWFPDR